MMKKIMLLGMLAPLFVACSAEDPAIEESSNEVTEGLHQTYDIQSEDLVGKWNLVSMNSLDVPVDLDLNSVESKDILTETTCFESMYFNFDLNGKVTTRQARLFFETESGAMACDAGTYSADYVVDGNVLTVNFTFQGISSSENRTIDVYEVNGEEFLEMKLTYAEAKAYISNPDFVSPTGATSVGAVTMLYKKE